MAANNWRQVTWVVNTTRPLQFIEKTCRFFERINWSLGQSIAWLSFFMAVTVFTIVVARYGFDSGSIQVQEAVIYMHALLFMLCGAYCWQHGMHVRIDVIYAKLSPRNQTLVDLLGTLLFLLPTCLFIFYISFDYVIASWSYKEGSTEPGGLPYRYLLKSVLLIMPVSILLQGVADLFRHYFVLRGWLVYQELALDSSQDGLTKPPASSS